MLEFVPMTVVRGLTKWSTRLLSLSTRIAHLEISKIGDSELLFHSKRLTIIFRSEAILGGRYLRDYVAKIIRADAKNYSTAEDFVMRSHFFFTQLSHPTSVTDAPGIPLLAKGLAEISKAYWQPDRLKTKIKEIATSAQGVENPTKELYHYLRKVLADGKDGAGVADIMAMLGRKESLRRLGGDVSRSNV